MSFTTLFPRVATGTLLLALLGVCLYMGPTWLTCLAFVFAALALWEFYSLFWRETGLPLKIAGVALCGVMMLAGWYGSAVLAEPGYGDIALSLAVSGILLAIMFLIRFNMEESSARLEEFALTAFGLLYIVVPLLLALRMDVTGLLFLFAVTIAADTFAYMAGNLWGKHKIWPKVSPKKSVEGCAAGLLGVILVCIVFDVYRGTFGFGRAVVMGLALAFAAMLGDFFESALKRRQGVKDSGSILPGHGGVLDRLDSFLFVVPAYAVMDCLLSLNI